MFDSQLVSGFSTELEKIALGVGTFQSYLGRRAAQGVGGASALGSSLAGTAAQTSRQAVQGMNPLQKFRLQGVMEGGQAVRKMEQLPNKLGLGPTAQATRQRVGNAIKNEALTGTSRKGGNALSAKYEGYMTDTRRAYTPEHVGQVLGISPEEARVSMAPPKLITANHAPAQSAVQLSGPATPLREATQPTVPSSFPPPMKATVPPPRRRRG